MPPHPNATTQPGEEGNTMWDTAIEITSHLTHDLPCPRCGHGGHRFLPCDHCRCSGSASTAYVGEREPAIAH